jgi:two-component system cell cycle response regulator
MTSCPAAGAQRAPLGSAGDLRRRLRGQRRSRPVLVRLYAALFREAGLVGSIARRRAARFALRSLPALVTVVLVALLLLGAFAGLMLGWPQAAAMAVLVATLGAVALRRARRAAEGRLATAREQLELGSLFVVAAYAVAQTAAGAGGGLEGPLFPVVYLVMAFLVSFLPRAVGLSLVAFAVGLDLAIWQVRGGLAEDAAVTAAHAGFAVLFATLYHAVLAAQLAASRGAERAAIERRLREIDERAREFRLLSPAIAAPGEDGEDRARRFAEAAVVEVEAAVRGTLEVAEAALAAHTCALFLLGADDRDLVLRECRSPSDAVARRPVPAREGALGSVIVRGVPVRMQGDLRGVSYYDDETRPRALLAVPLLERRGGHVRGVLVVDRLQDLPFGEADERLLVLLAAEVVRAVAAERLMGDLKRERDEKERFYEAIERLNRLSKPRDVFDAALQVAAGMVPIDFGAVTLFEAQERPVHRIARVVAGEGAEKRAAALEGLEFPDNAGLVASAVRLGSTLPGKDLKPSEAVVFGDATRLKGLGSLKVLPLKSGETVLGTLVLGSRCERAFDREAVRQLEVIAIQAADAVLRARLFEQTERLATTDGLTGVLNHRTFQARLDEHLAQAERYAKKLSLILCDIDHFKSVNDTYGHPAGDQVLRGVARVIAKEARATDLVARYGGEEFAIVMPETDASGAMVIAERIREKVRALVFKTELGPLSVTLSLGIATCPDDAAAKSRLIELADGCLYHAKRHGRNQAVSVRAQKQRKQAP